MFIVTMVFLAALIFAVQQLLYQYSFLDTSEPLRGQENQLLWSIRDSFSQALNSTDECIPALRLMEELDAFLSRQTFRGLDLGLSYNNRDDPNLDCPAWNAGDPALILKITLTGPTTQSEVTYTYDRNGLI